MWQGSVSRQALCSCWLSNHLPQRPSNSPLRLLSVPSSHLATPSLPSHRPGSSIPIPRDSSPRLCNAASAALSLPPQPTSRLTLVVGKLQVVIHGGHELLHEVATHVGGQVGLTVHLALQGLCKEIDLDGTGREGLGGRFAPADGNPDGSGRQPSPAGGKGPW